MCVCVCFVASWWSAHSLANPFHCPDTKHFQFTFNWKVKLRVHPVHPGQQWNSFETSTLLDTGLLLLLLLLLLCSLRVPLHCCAIFSTFLHNFSFFFPFFQLILTSQRHRWMATVVERVLTPGRAVATALSSCPPRLRQLLLNQFNWLLLRINPMKWRERGNPIRPTISTPFVKCHQYSNANCCSFKQV